MEADVLFLGTGGAFSAGSRSNLSLLLEAGDFRMLIEAGPVIMAQLARANLRATEIERLFISHSHGDHMLGFPMLTLNRLPTPTPLHVYASASTVSAIKILWEIAYSGFDTGRLNLQWHALSDEGPDEIELTEGITMRTAVVPHPPGTPTLAARWDISHGPSITFATDTFANEVTVELARGSDLLIHEASFSAVLQPDADPAVNYHSTARQAGEIARRAGCPRLALVHLSPEIGERPGLLAEEARASTDLQVFVPEDGERLRIGARQGEPVNNESCP